MKTKNCPGSNIWEGQNGVVEPREKTEQKKVMNPWWGGACAVFYVFPIFCWLSCVFMPKVESVVFLGLRPFLVHGCPCVGC